MLMNKQHVENMVKFVMYLTLNICQQVKTDVKLMVV